MGNCFLLAAVGWSLAPLGSAQERAEAEAKFASFSEAHCLNCHDAETHKGGLNLEALATDFGDRKAFETWVKVHDQMASGEMPPKKKAQPTPEAKGAVLAWLAQALREAGAARQEREGRTRYRRLTRVEYENTLRDLLALPNLEVKEMLPADAEAHGFDNNGEALTVSYVQMNRYLEAADAALDEALKLGPKPETEHQHDPALEVHDLTLAFHIRNGPHQGLELPNAVGLLRQTKPGQHPWLWNTFKVWVAGEYRLRFKLHAFDFEKGAVKAADRARGVLVYANTGQNKRWIASGEAAANAGEASVLEIQVYLHKGEEIELYFPDLARATGNLEQFSGPGAAIEWLEAEGPLLDSWPPESQRRLLGDLPVVPWTAASGLQQPPAPVEISGFSKRAIPKANEKVTRFMAVSRQPAEDAERLLRSFTERAFRRTVADEEVQRYVKLVQAKLDQKVCFQEALQEGCKAVLCSPDFLYLQEKPGRLDGYALASRLSYFLWSSMPDQTLLDLAADGTLGHPPVLLAQVDRMLADGKAHRFTENFTGQWLGLRGMRTTDPDEDLYPEFTDLLLTSMVKETQAFFEEMLRGDLGVSHVVSADFAIAE